MHSLTLREATVADEQALAALHRASPDGGAVRFTVESHVPETGPPAGGHEHSLVVVAEAAGALVGSARLSTGTCWFEGEQVRYALLHALGVHPDHRRRGIAAALTRWRRQRAEELLGPDPLLLANIQGGNVASTANAARWTTARTAPLTVAPLPMRRRPPRPRPDLHVRPVRDAELVRVSAELTERHRQRNFARAVGEADLRRWLTTSPFDDPVHHHLVVADASGRLLAGVGLTEEGRVRSMLVHAMPPLIRLANAALHVIPPDRVMRHLEVAHLWFDPDRPDAARHLLQTAGGSGATAAPPCSRPSTDGPRRRPC